MPLNDREKEVLQQFERGRRLKETVNSAGWKDLLEIMEQRVERAKYNLINADYAAPEIIQAFHRRARDAQEFYQVVTDEVNKAIEVSKEVPRLLTQDPTEFDGEI